jgi:thiamine-monophosphate kinase
MTERVNRLGEFELIAKHFAPLAGKTPGAYGLKDDAAVLTPAAGHDLVLTTDAVVAGVHFFPSDPPATIAQKALRVNISDLAAKGATPRVYLLTLALPPGVDDAWFTAFASGLRRDQVRFGVTLVGGDTVATPGPLTISVTALGEVARGKMLLRGGAKAGDDIWVSGTIGDAALGLRVAKAEDVGLDKKHGASVLHRFRIPEPRWVLGRALVGVAHACLDVSDGLIADLGHMSEVSGVKIEVEAQTVPLSPAARSALTAGRIGLSDLLTGGDDYELAFSAPAARRHQLSALALTTKTKLSRVGRVFKGKGVVALDRQGAEIGFTRKGFAHF